MPPERGAPRVEALAERMSLPPQQIRLALRYDAEYPDDGDRHIALVAEEAERPFMSRAPRPQAM